jgi:hypothetical protein
MSDFIEFTLYNGAVKGKFYPHTHAYYANGKRKTGVTSICGIKDKSMALVPWALEEAAKHLFALNESGIGIDRAAIAQAVFASDEAKTKAADLGTAIHDWCERYIRNKLSEAGFETAPEMPDDPNVVTGVLSFLEWESSHNVVFQWAEKVVYSRKHDYIGKADFAAIVDGKTCLCDLKSGNGLYNGVLMQTAAYAKADEEESGTKYEGRWAIRLAKETEAEYIERMMIKNTIKELLGKSTREITPYQVFEAKFLDDDGDNMQRDFDGFLAAWTLLKWDRATDFYKNA